VVATASEPDPPAGILPSSVDARQPSIFAASWTLGSLKFLAQSGASLVTYYETVGWKGLIQGRFPSDCPNKFHAEANDIFPIYTALKELSGFTEVIHSNSSHPLMFDGLVVRSDIGIKVFLFSFAAEELEITMNPFVQLKRIKSSLYHAKLCKTATSVILSPGDLVVIEI